MLHILYESSPSIPINCILLPFGQPYFIAHDGWFSGITMYRMRCLAFSVGPNDAFPISEKGMVNQTFVCSASPPPSSITTKVLYTRPFLNALKNIAGGF